MEGTLRLERGNRPAERYDLRRSGLLGLTQDDFSGIRGSQAQNVRVRQPLALAKPTKGVIHNIIYRNGRNDEVTDRGLGDPGRTAATGGQVQRGPRQVPAHPGRDLSVLRTIERGVRTHFHKDVRAVQPHLHDLPAEREV